MSAGVLVDSSVWADIFGGRTSGAPLAGVQIHAHEFVIGELLLGTLSRGHPGLRYLAILSRAPTLPHDEVAALVWQHRLEGSGIGWVDAHLLASARLSGLDLATRDQSLQRAAARVGVRTR